MQTLGLVSNSLASSEGGLERSEAALVERLNDGLEGRGSRFPLKFPQPLEQSFHIFNAEQALSAVRASCVILLFLLLGTGIIDSLTMSEIAGSLWKVRIPTIGLCLAMLLLSYTLGFVAYQHWMIFSYLCVSAFAYLNLAYLGSGSYSYLYSAMLGLGSFFLLIMSRSLFRWGLLCGVTLIVFANIFWITYQSINMELLVVNNGILTCCLAMSLFANYLYEIENRKNYLHLQKARLARFERKELEESNDRFRFLVSLDSVTGVANKSSMDRGFLQKLQLYRSQPFRDYL